jgi:hypothetical protein
MTYFNAQGQGRVGWRSLVVTQVVNAVDADAQAFITVAGITNLTQASAINTLVNDLKAYGLWTKMKALYPMVGGTATTHKWNLKDPRDLDAAYRLVFTGGWTHTATGAKPNGTTGYANTFLNPSVMAQNSTHASVYLRTNIDGLYFDIYGENSASGLGMLVKYTGKSYLYMNVLSSNNIINSNPSTGFFIGSRTASTTSALFQNGNKIINGTQPSLTPNSTQPIYLGAGNYSGTPSSYSPRESAFATIGDGLTDTEAANFYTAVQKYQTTLGRQV